MVQFFTLLSHTTELVETSLPLFCPLSLSPEKRGYILSDWCLLLCPLEGVTDFVQKGGFGLPCCRDISHQEQLQLPRLQGPHVSQGHGFGDSNTWWELKLATDSVRQRWPTLSPYTWSLLGFSGEGETEVLHGTLLYNWSTHSSWRHVVPRKSLLSQNTFSCLLLQGSPCQETILPDGVKGAGHCMTDQLISRICSSSWGTFLFLSLSSFTLLILTRLNLQIYLTAFPP